jgi:GT2 family glycosyltransferase
LKSLFNSTLNSKIILIDNNSTDGTATHIAEHYPDVILIKLEKNYGFGKANNIGLRIALKNKTDFVLLLNQDAFVEKKTLEQLVNCQMNNRNFGIISPLQLNSTGKELDEKFCEELIATKNYSLLSDFILKKNNRDVYETSFIMAASWLISGECLEKVGGFDPSFSLYGEDNNYCQRVNYHNYKIGILVNARIFHDREGRIELKKITIKKALGRQNVLLRNINIPLNESIPRFTKTLFIYSIGLLIKFRIRMLISYIIGIINIIIGCYGLNSARKQMRKGPVFL